MLGGEGGEALEVRDDCFGAGHIAFAGRVHEVELRVDVPEEARRHGRDLGSAPASIGFPWYGVLQEINPAESPRRYVAL